MEQKKYIQVILPLKLDFEPWYSTTAELSVGDRVEVMLQGRKLVGVVSNVQNHADGVDEKKIRPVIGSLPGLRAISATELKLWRFCASYYLCSIGEVYKCAYPKGIVSSEKCEIESLSRRQKQLEQRKAKLQATIEARRASTRKNIKAELTQKYVEMIEKIDSEQLRISEILALRSLSATVIEPTAEHRQKPLLLHGSNRVESYIQAAQTCVEAGKSVLALTPEADISDNLEERFSEAFPDQLRVHNFRCTSASRRENLNTLRDADDCVVILGTRSSVFLPFNRLGLIIVDEEQDRSFKQSEHAPRYNARDLALVLADIHGADVILGSECPSLETVLNCMMGKYDSKTLASEKCSEVTLVDIPSERRKRGMLGPISRKLIEAISECEGMVTLVRGWENPDEVFAELQKHFPGRDFQILTANDARKNTNHSDLIAVLQADAMFPSDDFRADEKALRFLVQMSSRCSRLVVQTAKAEHPVYKAFESPSASMALLKERQEFALPPFTRIVDVKDIYGNLVERCILEKDRTLEQKKSAIRSKYGAGYVFDVDPD